MLNEISVLNKKIEKLLQEKTKAEAQKELLEKKLASEITNYSTRYGVDLSGETFAAMKKNILTEYKHVHSKVEKEYKLASEVVSAIEDGDISKAYSLMGISPEPEADDTVDLEAEEHEEAAENTRIEELEEEPEEDFKLAISGEDEDDSNASEGAIDFLNVELSVDDTGDLEDDFYSGVSDSDSADDDFKWDFPTTFE